MASARTSNSISVIIAIALLFGALNVNAQQPKTAVEDDVIIRFENLNLSATGNSENINTLLIDEQKSLTDTYSAVLNKNVQFAGRYAIDLDAAYLPDEAATNAKYSALRLSKYLNENYSFGFGLRQRYGGLTTLAQQLEQTASAPEFARAPEAKRAAYVAFGYNLFYGKMSMLKYWVPTTLAKLYTDFGVQAYGEKNRPFVQLGLNQMFFLNRYTAVGFHLGFGFAQITDATSIDIRSSQPVPNESSFSDRIQFTRHMGVNLNILL